MKHIENHARLVKVLEEYSVVLQHMMRLDAVQEMNNQRLNSPSGTVLNPLSLREYFDEKVKTDPDFLTWLFPYCSQQITLETCSHMHADILRHFRAALPDDPAVSDVFFTSEIE